VCDLSCENAVYKLCFVLCIKNGLQNLHKLFAFITHQSITALHNFFGLFITLNCVFVHTFHKAYNNNYVLHII